MIRVILPAHLRSLARISGELALPVDEPVTMHALLDELEAQYPMLRGTIRQYHDRQRRPFIRFFAAGADLSHEPLDRELPAVVASGAAPLRIVGALAGG